MTNDFQDLYNQLYEVYLERDRLYPLQDKENSQKKNELSSQLRSIIIKRASESLDLSKDYEYNKELVNNPVFINGQMKSGSTLIIELLDDHPNLLVFPGDSKFHNQISQFEKRMVSKEQIVDHWLSRLFNPKGQFPFFLLGDQEVPYISFVRVFTTLIKNSHSEFQILDAIVKTFQTLKKNTNELSYWVAKNPGDEANIKYWKRLLPKSKFIYVLRDPISNFQSLKKQSEYRNWKWEIRERIKIQMKSYDLIHKAKKKYQKDVMILSYDGLVASPNNYSNTLCSFLNIPNSRSLLTPSIFGKSTKSNSMFRDKIQKDRIYNDTNKKIDFLFKNEVDLIQSKLYKRYELLLKMLNE